MTTPNSTISEPYKHLRIAKAFYGSAGSTMTKASLLGVLGFERFVPEHFVWAAQLALKQLRFSVLNEMHTNSYTGPRLIFQNYILKNSEIFFFTR